MNKDADRHETDDEFAARITGHDKAKEDAAEAKRLLAAEKLKAEMAPPQEGKAPRKIESAVKPDVPQATAVVVPMGRARKGRKPLNADQIKAKADAAALRSKGKDPKEGKLFEFKKNRSIDEVKAVVKAAIARLPKAGKVPSEKAVITAKLGDETPVMRVPPAPRASVATMYSEAARGKLPAVHHNFYTAPTHSGYVKRMKELEGMGKKGDLAGLRKALKDPFWAKETSSRAIVRRWIDAAVIALEVKAKGK